MFHKVQKVTPISNYNLIVLFTNGKQKYYDVTPLFNKWDSFSSLKNIKGLFEQVKVDTGGYGISWNDEIDLSCDELYENGIDIKDVEPIEKLRNCI